MKKLIALFGFIVLTSVGIATFSYATGSKIIEGSVLKIEGEFYTVHDTAGHEVRLHVDKSTISRAAPSKWVTGSRPT